MDTYNDHALAYMNWQHLMIIKKSYNKYYMMATVFCMYTHDTPFSNLHYILFAWFYYESSLDNQHQEHKKVS